MSDFPYLEKFLKTGKLEPDACYYFDPPLKEMEMHQLKELFEGVRGKEVVTNPLEFEINADTIKELLWFETDGGGNITGWQNPESEYGPDGQGHHEPPLLNTEDIINWFRRHGEYDYLTFISGRQFIHNYTDLFDQLNEGKLNEIGGKRTKDTHIIYRDPNMLIVVPLSFESAKSFSRKTQYCTGGDCSKGSENTSKSMYNQHTKAGDILYRLFFKDGTKVRLTWNGDIGDKNFHWGLGKKDSYPTFISRNMSNPFDMEQIREIRNEQLEIEFETEPREKEFEEWEKKFCSQWGWDVHDLWTVYQKIRKKWGFPDWSSGYTEPMDLQKHAKMQKEEEEVYKIYNNKKKEIFGKYYGKTAWWNEGHELLYKAIIRIPEQAITKMVEYITSNQYKPRPVPIKEGDMYFRDDIRTLNIGDQIYVSRVNPRLNECDNDGYRLLQEIVRQMVTVVGTTKDADLCQEDDEQYQDYGILISHPNLDGHDGDGSEYCKKENCFWVNSFYITFTKVDHFDTDKVFDTLYEQEEDEFDWVTDIGLPKDIDDSKLRKLTNYKLMPLLIGDLSPGLFIKRRNGKFLYELGEATVENYMIDGVEYRNESAPGFMLKNLSNGKLYFTKTKHILREFFAIKPKD